mmetsp:Transcript_22648/g.26141  ORF Transcript_22648/g.26141 Transcript_22648/m.26141 type:complete len:440 (+) Transcript_22648:136-1455(+)
MTRSGGFALATLATVSIACNYATRSLIPIVSHAVCSEGSETDCTAAELVSDSTSAFFVGDLLAQFTAGPLVRLVAGPWLLALSTAGWAVSTLFLPSALKSSSPQRHHSLLQGLRGLLCGFGYPSAHAVVATTPHEIRSTVLGLINAAAGIGAMLANFVLPELLSRHSWEVSIHALGVLSLVSAAALMLLSLKSRVGLFTQLKGKQPSTSKNSPGVKQDSVGGDILQWLGEPLIRGIIVWMVVVSIGGQAIGGAFLPTFFIERHGLSVATLGFYTGIPPLAQVIVSLSAGFACDILAAKAGIPARSMQIKLQQLAVGIPMLSLLLLSRLENQPMAACVLVTLWLGCTSFQSAGAMAVLHAVGGSRAGEMFVLGNAFAKLGTLLAASGTRWLLHTFGWEVLLIGLAGAYALSGVLLLPHMHHVERAAAVVAGDKAVQKKKD